MILDPILLFIFPLALIIIALVFDSYVFSFLGGIAAIFAGISYIDTLWVGLIYIGLGVYFMLIPAFADWEE